MFADREREIPAQGIAQHRLRMAAAVDGRHRDIEPLLAAGIDSGLGHLHGNVHRKARDRYCHRRLFLTRDGRKRECDSGADNDTCTFHGCTSPRQWWMEVGVAQGRAYSEPGRNTSYLVKAYR